jgi:Domain of unknown function (DUF5916)
VCSDKRIRVLGVALIVWSIGGASIGAAQESAITRSAAVMTIQDPITIDGALNEPIWVSSPTIGSLIQRQPFPGEAPTESTEVTLLRDEDNLYIGVRAFDSEANRVIGTQMARDASLGADDRIELLLDTFSDRRTAFYFATNPSGALVDGLVFANGQLNLEWDAIWRVRTSRGRDGWSAEFAIPFKSLSFPAGQDVWGFNVSRTIYRKLEDNRWSGAQLQTQFLQVSEAGRLTNLGHLTQGIALDVRPFLAGSWLNLRTEGDDWNRKPGLDAFYNLTPSLKATVTFNTDFGETEVDARQINLTRFSLLYPEKRAFFLEGAGVFSFASTGPETPGGIPAAGADVFPFFSRQIGLLAGQEVPIDAGIKLIGTAGRTEVGVLDVRTGDLRVDDRLITDEKNFFIGRVKRNLFRQSYVGAIVTAGNPVEGEGRTYAADLRLATSRFLGAQRNMVVNAFAARSDNGERSRDDWSYGFSAHYPNDKYLAQFVIREIQENFRPALGFVQRNNVRMMRAAASYNPRPEKLLNIQQMNHDVFYTQFTRLDLNEIESWDVYVTWLDWHFNSGDNIHGILDFNPTYERLFEPFEISPGVILMPGEYRFTRFRTNLFSSASKRRLSGSANVTWGNYWSGEAEQWTTSVTFKLPPRFTFSLNTNQTFARLPEGRFTAKIFTSNISYAASPSLSFSNLIQYDNRSSNLGWQSRVRWTLQPGNDLFVAINQGWIHELDDVRSDRRLRVEETKVSAKFQYSFRF